jgi:hypothetical protein
MGWIYLSADSAEARGFVEERLGVDIAKTIQFNDVSVERGE